MSAVITRSPRARLRTMWLSATSMPRGTCSARMYGEGGVRSGFSLGMVSGMLIVGALISVNLGHEPVGADPARYIATMHLAFWVLAAVTDAARALSAARVR